MACIRLMLRCLLVVTVALGLASAPLYAAVLSEASDHGASTHAVGTTHSSLSQPDHHGDGTSKPHEARQSCCHPGCIMAVVPVLSNLAQGVPLSESVPIPPDLTPVPAMPSGIDRPPKRA